MSDCNRMQIMETATGAVSSSSQGLSQEKDLIQPFPDLDLAYGETVFFCVHATKDPKPNGGEYLLVFSQCFLA